MKKDTQFKNVLITTKHRGVWFAQVDPEQDLSTTTLKDLKNCRMAIKWGTTEGIQQLCKTGPTNDSKISDRADILILHDVTAVFAVTDQAASKWKKHG